jgi:hypothetical protein
MGKLDTSRLVKLDAVPTTRCSFRRTYRSCISLCCWFGSADEIHRRLATLLDGEGAGARGADSDRDCKHEKLEDLSALQHCGRLRAEDELAAGTRYRTIVIITALFGFIPFLIGPPLTFAFSRQQMDATKIFTSLSYLLLLTNPLTQIFQSVPELLSGLACLGRIQSFLEYADRARSLAHADTTQHKGEK